VPLAELHEPLGDGRHQGFAAEGLIEDRPLDLPFDAFHLVPLVEEADDAGGLLELLHQLAGEGQHLLVGVRIGGFVAGGFGDLRQQHAMEGIFGFAEAQLARLLTALPLHAIAEQQQLLHQLLPFVFLLLDDLLQAAGEGLVVLRVIVEVDLEVGPDGVFHLGGFGPVAGLRSEQLLKLHIKQFGGRHPWIHAGGAHVFFDQGPHLLAAFRTIPDRAAVRGEHLQQQVAQVVLGRAGGWAGGRIAHRHLGSGAILSLLQPCCPLCTGCMKTACIALA